MNTNCIVDFPHRDTEPRRSIERKGISVPLFFCDEGNLCKSVFICGFTFYEYTSSSFSSMMPEWWQKCKCFYNKTALTKGENECCEK